MCHIVSSSPNVRKRHTAINANSPPALLAAPWSPSGPADASGEIIIFAFDAFLEMSAGQVAWRVAERGDERDALLSSPGYTCSVMHSRAAEGPNGGERPFLLPASSTLCTIALLQPTDRPLSSLSFRPSHPHTPSLSLTLRSTQHIPRLDARCRHQRMLLLALFLDFLEISLPFCFSSLSLFMTFAD